MCGIIGYYNKSGENVVDTLLTGLKRLEYRGYDSAGIATIKSNKDILWKKEVGKVINLEKEINKIEDFDESQIGIAHTRWATHGIPSVENAHPHRSNDGKIFLVHNGIIENYLELKKALEKKGIEFYSQTDTEVLANLIAVNYTGDLKNAVIESLKQIEGAYAVVVFCTDRPDYLLGFKNGSPLVMGIGNNEYILASDVSAIISKTKKVLYIEDREIVEIENGDYKLMSFNQKEKKPYIKEIEWDDEAATKEGYDSYLLKEIMEQPKSIVDCTRGRLQLEEGDVKFGGLIDIQDRLLEIDKVIILGMGSAYFAAQLGALFFENLANISSKAEMSSEFRYKQNVIDKKTWVIALSQSGETKDTIEAVKEAKGKGALVTGIVNVVGSTIARMTEAGVYNHVGPEISVASTKAVTSHYLLCLMHAIKLGKTRGLNSYNATTLLSEIGKLPDYIQKALSYSEDIRLVAKKYLDKKNFVYLGRWFNLPLAREGAIKFKELTYRHAEAFSGGELKHGPISMIDENFPTLAICNQDALYDKQISSIIEIRSRRGPVIALANEGDESIKEQVSDVIYVPKSNSPEVQSIINNISLQLFAYHFTVLLDNDVDKPRNLAKSVTVE